MNISLQAFQSCYIALAHEQEPVWALWQHMSEHHQELLEKVLLELNNPHVVAGYIQSQMELGQNIFQHLEHTNYCFPPSMTLKDLHRFDCGFDQMNDDGARGHEKLCMATTVLLKSACMNNRPDILKWLFDHPTVRYNAMQQHLHRSASLKTTLLDRAKRAQAKGFEEVAIQSIGVLRDVFGAQEKLLKSHFGDLYTKYERHLLLENLDTTQPHLIAQPKKVM